MVQQPQKRRGAALVVGVLAGGAGLLQWAASPSVRSFIAPEVGVAPHAAAPFVADSACMRMPEARGEAAPRTMMRGRYPNRSGNNRQGGPRNPIWVTRKAVLAYSVKDEETNEPAAGVLRRMWDMYDMDFEKMRCEQSRYFRLRQKNKEWREKFEHNIWRRDKKRRSRKELEEEWQQWMRTVGRKMGLTQPILYGGPMAQMTPEEEEVFTPSKGVNHFAHIDKTPGLIRYKEAFSEMEDMKPGRWNHDGTAEMMFKIWRRPLTKYPFDIGTLRKRTRGKVAHGNVMGGGLPGAV